jgi:hypothetical protein
MKVLKYFSKIKVAKIFFVTTTIRTMVQNLCQCAMLLNRPTEFSLQVVQKIYLRQNKSTALEITKMRVLNYLRIKYLQKKYQAI